MAPPKDTTASDEADMVFILNVIVASEEFKVNAPAIAKAVGIKNANNVYPKLHKILGKRGFKYENKRITRDNGEQAGGGITLPTPVKKSGGRTKPVEDLDSDIESGTATSSKAPAKKSNDEEKPKGKKRKANSDTEAGDDDAQVD